MVQTLNELRERREREWQERLLAVIAEFGTQRRQPLLVPEDDPGNDAICCASLARFYSYAINYNASPPRWNGHRPVNRARASHRVPSRVCLILLSERLQACIPPDHAPY